MTFEPATHGADRTRRLTRVAIGLVAMALPLAGARAPAALPDAQRTNGAETLQALNEVLRGASAATLQLGKTKDQSISGVAITEDGYVLTQASDSAQLEPLLALFSDGTTASAREVKRSDRLNLLLLKLDRTGLHPVSWGSSKSVQVGQWLCATTQQGRELRLGVCSAKRRTIPNSGAVLGVRFGADDDDSGVVVEEIAEQSPAQKAGLQAEDLILAVDNQRVARNGQLSKLIASHRPGDVVKVRYAREGQETECEVRL
ncbi:MAG: S1C family serine protease, partial [Roseimicrobium sp.]